MTKRVLDVGQCGPDHSSIRHYLTTNFDCEVVQAHGVDDTLALLRSGQYDLVLINRKLDNDYSDGVEIIRTIKAGETTRDVPVMLVTNYPEHQAVAVSAGAIPGFGKLEFGRPDTKEKLAAVLAT